MPLKNNILIHSTAGSGKTTCLVKVALNNADKKILITTSCKAAIKAGDELTMWQMQELIKNWRGCKEPYTCPHGRPISKLLKHKDIAAFFSRNK